jgi:hypothetical protein
MTPDGRRAVSASLDKTLRVWDLESGKELALLTTDAPMASCAASLDGRTSVGGDVTGNMHFLRLVEANETKPVIRDTKIPPLQSVFTFCHVTRETKGTAASSSSRQMRTVAPQIYFFTVLIHLESSGSSFQPLTSACTATRHTSRCSSEAARLIIARCLVIFPVAR